MPLQKTFILIIILVLFMVTVYQVSLNLHQYCTIQDVSTPKIRNFFKILQKNHSGNFPDLYLTDSKKPTRFNATCAKFPALLDIKFKNNHWQIQKTSIGTFHLFGAYLDRRVSPMIRILGTFNKLHPKVKFFCQFWYEDSSSPQVVLSENLFWLFYPSWGADTDSFEQPYLITCPLKGKAVPMSVSLVEKPCDYATNNLEIHQKKEEEKKKNFIVCVKGMSFPFKDNSIRLVEWIELLNILGAEKISFYEFNLHQKSKRVLDYYESLGRIEVTSLSLVGDVSNEPYLQKQYLNVKPTERRLQEVIPYNDCFYKHLEFKFVVLLDVDEVIVPVNNTWVELMEILQRSTPNRSSYVARNVYFVDKLRDHEWFEGIPKYMHMLQHVYRARNYSAPGYYVKGFHDSEKVLALHNHFPLACLESCSSFEINVTLAHLQHYRINSDVVKNNSVVDTRVWNFKNELVKRVARVVEGLELDDEKLDETTHH